jgi:citrate lyase subunit beta/citryl-CoA lyase
MIGKAQTLAADEVVIDLEDSVPAELKDQARDRAAAALAASEWTARSVALRVNAVDSEWFAEDLMVVATSRGSRLESLVVPKVETVEALKRVDELLAGIEREYGLASVAVQALIETALGLVNVEALADATTRVKALIFGPADLAASLGIPQLRIGTTDSRYPGDQWHYARSRIAIAAAANGIYAIDGPFAAFEDAVGFSATATEARLLGFAGKWVIHPNQIELCNEVFTPSADEVEWAARVEQELERVGKTRGASADAGSMIDEASRRVAAQIMARSRQTSGPRINGE